MASGLSFGTVSVVFLATRALAVNATYQPDENCASFEKKCSSYWP